MYKPLCCALTVACLALTACATPTPPAPAPPPAQAVSATPPPIPDTGLRHVPPLKGPVTEDFYPPPAKRLGQTGRVLVEFRIKDKGRATAATVAAAEAPPVLQKAAVQMVDSVTFDLSSKDYDASDPRPFHLSFVFCLATCGELKAYPGYEAVTVTGYLMRAP